jgi:Flp pilus assembly protein TadG
MAERRSLRSEGGQAAVEFALVLPLLLVLLLAIIEFGIAFSNYVTLTDAARVGARKAITIRLGGTTPADATQAVRDAAGDLNQSNLQVTVSDPDWTTAGSQITVKASYPYSIDIPLLGLSVVSGTLTAQAEERLE